MCPCVLCVGFSCCIVGISRWVCYIFVSPCCALCVACVVCSEWEAVAMFDYVARSAAELSFKQGDHLVLHSKASADWWRGEMGGVRGLIPHKYISVVEGWDHIHHKLGIICQPKLISFLSFIDLHDGWLNIAMNINNKNSDFRGLTSSTVYLTHPVLWYSGRSVRNEGRKRRVEGAALEIYQKINSWLNTAPGICLIIHFSGNNVQPILCRPTCTVFAVIPQHEGEQWQRVSARPAEDRQWRKQCGRGRQWQWQRKPHTETHPAGARGTTYSSYTFGSSCTSILRVRPLKLTSVQMDVFKNEWPLFFF